MFDVHKSKIIIAVSIIVILLFIFFNFKIKESVSVFGNYESVSPSLVEKAKFAIAGIECFYAGRRLTLLPDSTFVLTENNTTLNGQWHQSKDLLHLLSNKFQWDSLPGKSETPKISPDNYYLKWNNPDLYLFYINTGNECVEIFKTTGR